MDTAMAPVQSQDFYYDYLYTINPIAERIRKDVDATKDAYQPLWCGLSTDEQNKILEESIISPEIVLKYSKYNKSDEKLSEGGFSWFTRSQLDLCKHVDSVRENFSANECKTTVIKRIGNKDQQDNKLINKIKSHALFKSLMPTEDKSKIAKGDRIKPKGPPPPPPHQVVSNPKETIHEFAPNTYADDDDDIPKTGFDFLDNW
ncbi:Hypothetical protein CINCED_3A005993 [Cinara cedri]|uniref:DUF4706 domain-containing protein n=1 Tax=Cinara cedri TaxID=506608 RepID=A0A5E4M6G2_9HEMI|nr:Hypothetical protein CINCED_3A005993 [Cinara cedri]